MSGDRAGHCLRGACVPRFFYYYRRIDSGVGLEKTQLENFVDQKISCNTEARRICLSKGRAADKGLFCFDYYWLSSDKKVQSPGPSCST